MKNRPPKQLTKQQAKEFADVLVWIHRRAENLRQAASQSQAKKPESKTNEPASQNSG